MPNQNVFEQQMEDMKVEMREIRASMSQIAAAMTKLAVLEEKNSVFSSSLEKVSSKVDRMEERQRDEVLMREALIRMDTRVNIVEVKAEAAEMDRVRMKATADGVSKTLKVMWAVGGAGVIYAASHAFSFFINSMPIK